MIDPLPFIENQRYFEQQMDDLKKDQEDYANNNDKLYQLLDKIHNERHSWAKVYHLHNFTGDFNFCLRNEAIKFTLFPYLCRKEGSLEEMAKLMSKADCIKHP